MVLRRKILCCNVRGVRGIIPIASQLAKNVELVIIFLNMPVAGSPASVEELNCPCTRHIHFKSSCPTLPDIGELPLDAEVNVDDAEYARIMRRLIIVDGEPRQSGVRIQFFDLTRAMAVPGGTLPFREVVLKVHSRCDLACDHCYVYEHADQSWRGRPTLIAPETVARAAERIAEHARATGCRTCASSCTAGSRCWPACPGWPGSSGSCARRSSPSAALDLRIHTNGVRLNDEFCELFLAERVMVGISLDGDRAANDLHRRYADGRSSYEKALAAVGLLRQDRVPGDLRRPARHHRHPERADRRCTVRSPLLSRPALTSSSRTGRGTRRRPTRDCRA